ncbi:MAG TPA: hypothetical protein EYN91_22325 [Candidatus Melainabacteria bacterium]|nr:hypothetical protein [Candidatus Melainabacteria bacterium]HIN63494.1 hypothetical protein [Candidatus Obscuribacterales bacterium]
MKQTVEVPESIYRQLLKLAYKEHSNVPFVARQILSQGLSEQKGHPDWFYELSRQITGLRNEVASAQRANAQLETNGEALVTKQISELRKDIQDLLLLHRETKAKLDEFQLTAAASAPTKAKGSRWTLLTGRLSQAFQANRPPATDDVLSAAG